MLTTIITFILVLSVLVFVHEFGHFYSARKLGVKVEEFGFGFPPRAFGFYKRVDGQWRTVKGNVEVTDAADTIYSINWLPLGGFCKIKGEDGGDKAPDSFVSKPIWKRITIISAGVLMNIVLAAVIFSIGYMIGLPQGIDSSDKRAIVSDRKIVVVQVVENSPAWSAGLKEGDEIVSIDGQTFLNDAELREYTGAKPGQEATYQIRRDDGQSADYPVALKNNNGRGEAGIMIVNAGLVSYPWYLAIWKGLVTAILTIWMIIVAFWEIIKNLILGHGLTTEVVGPVGIASMTGQYARLGFIYLMQFTALLSLNLAVINFLPFPAMDGGRIIFLLIEKFKGSPVRRDWEAAIHNAGFFFLIALLILVTVRDVFRVAGKFRLLWERIIN
jgi:regulator of sigma E protease